MRTENCGEKNGFKKEGKGLTAVPVEGVCVCLIDNVNSVTESS